MFVDEELADLAWVYASVQVLKVGARSDGWHTDGGASLLHAGLTVFGKRALEARVRRSDLFRESRSRKKDAYPGPAELFELVNDETAKHLAQVLFFLPVLSEVLAESAD